MQTPDLLKLIWIKLDRPHSMCPDVEIGYVRRILGEAMAAEIKDREILSEEVDRWVLGQLLVSPMEEFSLAEEWYETNRVYQEQIQPTNDNYEDEGYLKAITEKFEAEDQERTQRAHEVAEAIGRLIGLRLVGMTLESGHQRYFGNIAVYRMLVERSSV
jgi:hypothetical protein